MPSGQFPAVLAGTILSAALLQEIAPWTAWKSADTPRSNTTTLANDPDLSVPVVANGSYLFLCGLFAAGAAISTGDLKVTFTWPAGGNGKWWSAGFATASATPNFNVARTASGSTVAFGVNGASSSGAILLGSLLNGSTAGSLTLQWAQNTSNATATTLQANSGILVVRMA